MNTMEKISFTDENGQVTEFFVEAETKLNGTNYILVSDDSDSDEAVALILKDISTAESEDADYVIVDDDVEINALLPLFAEIFEGEDTEIEF